LDPHKLLFHLRVAPLFCPRVTFPSRLHTTSGMSLDCHYQKSPLPQVSKALGGRLQNTRGRLPRVQHSWKANRGSDSRERGHPRVPNLVHSGKPSPSVMLPLGEDLTSSPGFFLLFPECNTRGRNSLFLNLFPECNTRRRNSFFRKPSSPSAHAQALTEAPWPFFKNVLPQVPNVQALGEAPALF
jgi:hypothetical protein